ncbi:MAG: UvrD-helicase domain-containing protein [Campylobacterales bacterium]
MDELLDALNPSQREAATTVDGPLLVLAGAGSGKTKTITARLAYLLSLGIDPQSTLTLTFTNKAAAEMRQRTVALLGTLPYPPLLATFHRFGLLFLRSHITKMGRPATFVVIDSDDQKRLVKHAADELTANLLLAAISRYKNRLITPDEALAEADKLSGEARRKALMAAQAFKDYQEALRRQNLVDFDDLLLLSYQLLEADPVFADEISRQYTFLMVDEYQDTNHLQFRLLQKLAGSHHNLCVVGDDDQSIYGWRGADVGNILAFRDHFPEAKIIRLEENYRSTPQILEVANRLIDVNTNRLGKTLRPTHPEGAPVRLIESEDERLEGDRIAREIKELLQRGVRPEEIAILFRLNALSRSLEEALSREKIPFKLVGGVRFYERQEIKDIISYLRLIINPADDYSFERIINRPRRGIGKVTLEKIKEAANRRHQGLFEHIASLTPNELVNLAGKKAGSELARLVSAVDELSCARHEQLYDFVDTFERTIGLRAFYAENPQEFERVVNIDEFYGLLREFAKMRADEGIEGFLADLALASDQDSVDNAAVNLMSIHASKGLEFDYLFVVGLEEGFFPLLGDSTDIEEERRLGYVALTRAKKELTLSYVKSRFYKGMRSQLYPSRFLSESGLKQTPSYQQATSSPKLAFAKGDLVRHKIFGAGRVISVSGQGAAMKLGINFGGQVREIIASFVEKI